MKSTIIDPVATYYYTALSPHRGDISVSDVLIICENLAAKTKRIQSSNRILEDAASLRMSFGEVDRNGIRKITAHVVRGKRLTRVVWVKVKEGANMVEALGKSGGGLTGNGDE